MSRAKSKLAVHRAAKPRVRDKLPTVRMLRPWRGYPVGATIKPSGLLRDVLVQEGVGEVVEEEVEVEEEIEDEDVVEDKSARNKNDAGKQS